MTDVFILAGLFNVSANWFWSLFRGFFALFDFIVYGFIEVFFRTIFNLANFELVGLYEIFEKRVYVILGIFMLFKVTVSLITYLVNPDKLTDKEQGMAKVVTRIITVLVMLIALPTFFNLMTEFQNKLLPVVPRVIMGTSNTLSSDNVSGIASNMSLTLLQGFAHFKDECVGSNVQNIWNTGQESTQTISDFLEHINDTCEYNGKKIYAYDYLPIISTLVGALAIYVLFSLCITVAIRAFKLIILRMLAPIPVVSYIDPKSSKDGMFSHWIKTFMSTWVELFILLGIIYFIVYILDFMLSADAWRGFFSGIDSSMALIDGTLLLVFLIIGLLMFARQAPKFIFDALGIKNNGSFARMLGMGAAAIGGVGAARAAYHARNEYDADNNRGSHRLRNFGASLFSGLGTSMAGGNALLSSDKPNLTTGFDAMAKNNATALSRIGAGSTLGGGLGAMGQTLWSGETEIDRLERDLKKREEELKNRETALKPQKDMAQHYASMNNRAKSKAEESEDTTGTFKGVTGNYRAYNSALKAAYSNGWSVDSTTGKRYFMFNGSKVYDYQAEDIRMGLFDENTKDYYTKSINGTIRDTSIAADRDALIRAGETPSSDLGNAKARMGELNTLVNDEQDAINREHQEINDERTSNNAQRMRANRDRFGSGGKQ